MVPPACPGGPGHTEQDPERFSRLVDDFERKVFGPLPDGTWVYPGHGKDTTLGAERPSLPGPPSDGQRIPPTGCHSLC